MSYAVLGGVLAALALAGAAYWKGSSDGQAHCEAAGAREERVARVAHEAAASAAAGAIAKMEVKHVTVRQQLEREIQTREVFRECRSGDAAVRLLNDAAGIATAASAAGAGQLPAAGAAGR